MGLFDLSNRTRAFGAVRRWQGQGGRWYSDVHKGDDYAETYGNDPVYAIQDAKVISNTYSSTYGWLVWARDLKDSSIVYKYHMLAAKSPVGVGATIHKGTTKLGTTGASAANASGNHLHMQVEKNGIPIDPRPYITGSFAGGGSTPIDNKPSVPPVDTKELNDMLMIHIPAGQPGNVSKTSHLFAISGSGYWNEFTGQDAANGFAAQIGGASVPVNLAFWTHCKRAAEAGLPRPVEASTVNVTVNADEIAKAVNDDAAERLRN